MSLMVANKFLFNPLKTKFLKLVLGGLRRNKKFEMLKSFKLVNSFVEFNDAARNLSGYFTLQCGFPTTQIVFVTCHKIIFIFVT